MKIFKVVNNMIHIHDGPVGVSCSGGADSSLLLFILMKYSQDPIHIFTCASKLKNYTAAATTTKVIDECIKITGNNNIFHHIHYVDEQTLDNLFYQDQFVNIQVLYTAITKNPPDEITNGFKNTSAEIERHPGTIRPLYSLNKKVYMPFANIDKKEISWMYKELQLLDNLFPLTRSCESFTLTKGHCGECWWCEEREWAFGKL